MSGTVDIFSDEPSTRYEDQFTNESHVDKDVSCQTEFSYKRIYRSELSHARAVCNASFSPRNDWFHHLQVHREEKPDSTCNKSFNFEKRLPVDFENQVREPPFKFGKRKRSFHLESALKCHLQTHTADNVFKCKTCEKSFRSKDTLRVHLVFHGEDDFFKCNICKNTLDLKSLLTRHLQEHTEKLIKCSICEQELGYKSNKKHSTVEPYVNTHLESSFFHKDKHTEHQGTYNLSGVFSEPSSSSMQKTCSGPANHSAIGYSRMQETCFGPVNLPVSGSSSMQETSSEPVNLSVKSGSCSMQESSSGPVNLFVSGTSSIQETSFGPLNLSVSGSSSIHETCSEPVNLSKSGSSSMQEISSGPVNLSVSGTSSMQETSSGLVNLFVSSSSSSQETCSEPVNLSVSGASSIQETCSEPVNLSISGSSSMQEISSGPVNLSVQSGSCSMQESSSGSVNVSVSSYPSTQETCSEPVNLSVSGSSNMQETYFGPVNLYVSGSPSGLLRHRGPENLATSSKTLNLPGSWNQSGHMAHYEPWDISSSELLSRSVPVTHFGQANHPSSFGQPAYSENHYRHGTDHGLETNCRPDTLYKSENKFEPGTLSGPKNHSELQSSFTTQTFLDSTFHLGHGPMASSGLGTDSPRETSMETGTHYRFDTHSRPMFFPELRTHSRPENLVVYATRTKSRTLYRDRNPSATRNIVELEAEPKLLTGSGIGTDDESVLGDCFLFETDSETETDSEIETDSDIWSDIEFEPDPSLLTDCSIQVDTGLGGLSQLEPDCVRGPSSLSGHENHSESLNIFESRLRQTRINSVYELPHQATPQVLKRTPDPVLSLGPRYTSETESGTEAESDLLTDVEFGTDSSLFTDSSVQIDTELGGESQLVGNCKRGPSSLSGQEDHSESLTIFESKLRQTGVNSAYELPRQAPPQVLKRTQNLSLCRTVI